MKQFDLCSFARNVHVKAVGWARRYAQLLFPKKRSSKLVADFLIELAKSAESFDIGRRLRLHIALA